METIQYLCIIIQKFQNDKFDNTITSGDADITILEDKYYSVLLNLYNLHNCLNNEKEQINLNL